MEKGRFCGCRCFSSEAGSYKGDLLYKNIKKENFEKHTMNLIEINHKINLFSEHSVSSNNSFKSHLNAKSFNMFLTV